MKKEYIAVYCGLALFLAAFLASALLDWAGHKHPSRISVDISVILFGVSILSGLYSNARNYGFFYTRVREEDVNLSIEQLDAKYPRVKQGTTGYRVGIACAALFGVAITLFGVAILLKELGVGTQ